MTVSVASGANTGSFAAFLDGDNEIGRASIILSVDLSGVDPISGDVDLEFAHRESDSNDPMPASFSGRVDADGVAISDDGVNWYRVVDLGQVNELNYAINRVDLDGAIRANGLTFSSNVQILFQHFLDDEGAFFDDIVVAPDLAGPSIVNVSTAGPLVFADNLSEITIEFSESLNAATRHVDQLL